MDAKSKANFINSVAEGQTVPCPTCGAGNKPGSTKCDTCGAAIGGTPAFASVTEDVSVPGESTSAFAEGLPAWDIVPPQVVVRRH